MTRASLLLIALSLVLPSCQSVSLGGGEDDGGAQPGDGSPAGGSGGSGGTSAMDAAVLGGQGGGGTSGTGTCAPRTFDADCYGALTIYTCVQRGGEWVWDYTCPEQPKDGGALLDSGSRGDALTCQGPSPAARTCRNSEADCIPSNCVCTSNGTWACTQDCISYPWCSDGGAPLGCDVTKAAEAVAAAGLTTVGEAQTSNEDLPANLSSGPNWGVKDIECEEGGYDLSSVAGKTVCLVSFDSTELCQDLPARVWVVMSDGVVRCIYKSAFATPGVYSVHDSSCSPSDAGVVGCPGSNPASRVCRSTTSDCIPSGCTCSADGWVCTADCRAFPLCADGGASDT